MRKHSLAECEICPLQHERCAPTAGPKNAKVAVVSRSPGSYDVRNGVPFSGPSGKVLDHMLNRNRVDRKDVLVTNLVLCYSDDPPKAAINACKVRLHSELAEAETIIAAGAEAVKEFLPGNPSITSVRGIKHSWNGKKVIATKNPAAVIYDSDSFPDLVEDFQLALNPIPAPEYPTVNVYTDARKAQKLLKELLEYDGLIATDLEGRYDHIECAGFAVKPTEAHVLTRTAIVKNADLFKQLYESDKQFLWHNGIFDCKLLRKNGINAKIVEDTYPLSYVLDEREEGVHSLKYLLRTKKGWPNYVPEAVEAYFETGEVSDELYQYNGMDTAGTLQLFEHLKPEAEKDDVWDLYKSHYIDTFNSFVDVELRGFPYDHIAAADLNEEVVLPALRRLKKEMAEIVGLEFFNPASSKQVNAYVYDTCGLSHTLKSTRKKNFERSFQDAIRVEILADRFTAKSAYVAKLKKFAYLHDAWAEIDTQRGRYIEGLIKLVSEDGRLYCSFNPCGTVTGRTSSRRPNFQNITRTERNVVPAIRTLFKPSPGHVLVQADYSQAELRCIAKFSGDSGLLAIYRDTARSLHRETATAFYGEDYTKDQYVKSKNINFGVCYGQSAFAFAQMYHMEQEEAQAYIDAWFKKFPDVDKWIKSVHKKILTDNYLTSPFGFKRRFWLITDENLGDTLREGVNFLPQNTAAFLTIKALNELNGMDVPIISTVHDSIIADVHMEDAYQTAEVMKEVMERQAMDHLGWDDIPFKVDISMSDESWGQLEEIELERSAI